MKTYLGKVLTMLIIFSCSFTGILYSQDSDKYSNGFTTGIGTLGPNVGTFYKFNDSIKIRINASHFSGDLDDLEYEDIEYDLDTDVSSISLCLDYYPLKKHFFTTIGLFYVDMKCDGKSKLIFNRRYEIGDKIYNSSEVGEIYGEYNISSLCPYIGMGWDYKVYKNISLIFDLGVMYNLDEPEVTLNSRLGTKSNSEELMNNLKKEEQDIEDETRYMGFMNLKVAYSF